MATLTITFGSNAGEGLRQLSRAIVLAATDSDVIDRGVTGAAVTLSIDNAPAGGDTCSVQVTSGPGGASHVYKVRA